MILPRMELLESLTNSLTQVRTIYSSLKKTEEQYYQILTKSRRLEDEKIIGETLSQLNFLIGPPSHK